MLASRQKVLAENIANSDTPGFTARDIDEKNFQRVLKMTMRGERQTGIAMQATEAGHIRGNRSKSSNANGLVRIIDAPGSETTLNGNSVVLPEQVASLADTRMRYNTAVGLYQKSLGLLRIAMKPPGR